MGYIPPEQLGLQASSLKKDYWFWRNTWVRALKNMPSNSRGDGQPAALCHLLGYPTKRVDGGGQYSAHNRIFTNLYRGSKPRDPVKTAKLLRLASHEGKLVAWLTLCKMGYGRKYTPKG